MEANRRAGIACVMAAGLVLGSAALVPRSVSGERTRFWRQSNYDEFEKGTANGVALRSDGKLALAPRFATFADPNAAYLWALRVDSKGRLYAAGGSNAKVLRFEEKGTATTLFEAPEMAAQALAIDAQDNLFVGTSPDGKVYRITPDGKQSVFFEPKTKYIWDLALDAAGTVYVATGDKGEVFAVAPNGTGTIFYKSEETHARALAFDAKGNVLIGTEPNGRILRVEKAAPAAGGTRQAFVLHETEKKEVTALVTDRAGNVYAAAIGDKARPGPPGLILPPTPPPAAQITAQQAGLQPPGAPPQVPFAPFPTMPGGSEVYRIAPDGAPEQLWSSREELVYALGLGPSGKLLLGTGNRGVVIQLEGNAVFSSLAKTASAQVTGLAQGAGGKVFLCTANPGKVFTLGPDDQPEGSFESQAFDAKNFSQWGRLTWWGVNGATNGQVSFYVRSGNTSNPEKNWSAWAGPFTNARGEGVTVPPARFVQWKAVFRAAAAPAKGSPGAVGNSGGPGITWVSLAYLPKNQAPTIDSIVLQNPGVRVQGFLPPQTSGTGNQPAQLRLPTSGPQAGAGPQPQLAGAQRFDPPPQGFVQKGAQGVVWSAKDANDDELTFSLYFRGEGETVWKLLKDKLDQKFYSWDTGTMPDGAYYLKVAVSDAASNPVGEALSAERESDRFEVDNTPPAIHNLRAELLSPEVRVRFEARDSYSAIARAEYSLDAGEWKTVFPTDRTTDAPDESYEVLLRVIALGGADASREVAAGEHTLAVRVYDQFENSVSAKVTFVVEGQKKK